MKIEVELGKYGKDSFEGIGVTWEFIDGRVEIFDKDHRLATYDRQWVVWVKRIEE